jgi:hypothetical protein
MGMSGITDGELFRWTGLTSQTPEDEEEEDFQEIDGVLIGPGGFAVTEEGAVISASKLSVPQLRAELIARGLSADGRRHDLYRRVQVRLQPQAWTLHTSA